MALLAHGHHEHLDTPRQIHRLYRNRRWPAPTVTRFDLWKQIRLCRLPHLSRRLLLLEHRLPHAPQSLIQHPSLLGEDGHTRHLWAGSRGKDVHDLLCVLLPTSRPAHLLEFGSLLRPRRGVYAL